MLAGQPVQRQLVQAWNVSSIGDEFQHAGRTGEAFEVVLAALRRADRCGRAAGSGWRLRSGTGADLLGANVHEFRNAILRPQLRWRRVHSGIFWAWLGGAGTAVEASFLQPTGEVAAGSNLPDLYGWWSTSVGTPPDPSATFNVKIERTTIFTLMPVTATAYNAGYALASVDVSACADSGSQALRFESCNASAFGSTDIQLDDIPIINDRVFAHGFK